MLDIPEAGNQVGDGGFSASRRADEGGDSTLSGRKADVVQRLGSGGLLFVLVCERDMAEFDVVRGGDFRMRGFGNRLPVEYPVDARYALVDLPGAAAQIHQFIHRRGDTRPQNDEEKPDCGQREARRIAPHQQNADGENERDRRIEQYGKADHSRLIGIADFESVCFVCFYFRMEPPERPDALAEYLYHRHTPDILYGRGAHLLLRIVIDACELPGGFPHEIGELDQNACGDYGEADACQVAVEREKDEKHDDNRRQDIDQIGNRMGDEVLDLFHVLLHRFLDGARRRPVQVAERQSSYMLRQPDA